MFHILMCKWTAGLSYELLYVIKAVKRLTLVANFRETINKLSSSSATSFLII